MTAFSVEVRHEDGGAEVVLVGQMDPAGLDELAAALRPLYHRYDANQLRIDCARLTVVDGHAVAELVRALAPFGPTGRPTLVAPSPRLRRILAATDFEDRFDLSA